MTEYRASLMRHDVASRFGPFTFQRVTFTSSAGQQVTAWGCSTTRYGRANARARTRVHALAYWFAGIAKHITREGT